jgi:outer membrane protein assembly factor BamB
MKMNFIKNKSKNKNICSIFAILMITTFVISMTTLPNTTNAQTTRDIATFPFIDYTPKPVGVGQPVLINCGLLNYLARDGDSWNVTATITDPDGKVETRELKTWSLGSVTFSYTPTKEGNYTLKCTFDRQYYNSGTSSVASGWYAASESENVTLTVIPDYWKPNYPGHSLPTEYWVRPIDSQLREWYSIAGSWAHKPANLYAPYNDAPESAHILWTMPLGDVMGGLTGGDTGDISYQDGDAYEGKFVDSIIISGVLYYNKYVSGSPQQAIVAVDLHTGEKLWEKSYTFGGSRISTGQILSFLSMNSHGAWSYIWMTSGSNMFALDAKNGELKYNMTNVPSGSIYWGPNGEMLKYRMYNYGTAANPNWYLQQWNATYVVNNGTREGTGDAWGVNIQGRTYDATRLGFDVNVSISGLTFVPGQSANPNTGATVAPIVAFPEDRVIFGNVTANGVTLTGISLDPENRGYRIFDKRTWQAPEVWQDITVTGGSQVGWAAFSQEDLVGVYWTKENRVNYCFSLETGKLLWETEPQGYANAWGGATSSRNVPEKIIAYNKLIEASVGGTVYCYDIKNGETLWTYDAQDKYTEAVLTGNWWLVPTIASSGKVYFGHHEHSANEPKPRGAPFFALDVESGDLVWEIDGAFRQTRWGGPAVIGDSIIATMDTYDLQIYAIGKGPSAMTVSAPDVAVTAGTPFVIRGTITDVSPGTQSSALQMRFANGVPAVSDESMSNWMLYVYKNFDRPNKVTGVDIDIWAFDPSGNEVHIGETVSDSSGKFSYTYTPETDGDYEIFAYFMGSKSYYGSYAKTDMTVMSAPEQITPETPPYEWYIIAAVIVIVVAIVINIFVTLRKK